MERATPRIEPVLPVTLALSRADGDPTFGIVSNISGGGACVLTYSELEIGTRVRCALNFPREPQPIGVDCQVVWAERLANVPSRYGVQFHPRSEQVTDLEQLIEQVSPN